MKDLMFPRKMDLTSRQTLQYYILEYRNHTLTHLIIAADSASIFTIYLPALSSLRERVDDDELDGASDVEPERKRRYHTDSESDTHPNVSEESSLKVWKLNQKKRKGRLCCPMPTRMRHSRRNEASSAGHCPNERSPSPPHCKDEEDLHQGFNVSVVVEVTPPLLHMRGKSQQARSKKIGPIPMHARNILVRLLKTGSPDCIEYGVSCTMQPGTSLTTKSKDSTPSTESSTTRERCSNGW